MTDRERLDRECPGLYAEFCLAVDRKRQRDGVKRLSARGILHAIREEWALMGKARSINDHHSATLSRLWIADHPRFASLFETRRSRLDRRDPRQPDMIDRAA